MRVLEDRENLLARLLPPADDSSFCCLRFIDPYQDTVFNQRQLQVLLTEFARMAQPKNDKEQHLIDDLRTLALAGAAEPHLYLKFYGD